MKYKVNQRAIGFGIGFLAGAALVLVFGTFLPFVSNDACKTSAGIWCKLYTWQTLVAGVFALCGAGYTVREIRRQIKTTSDLHNFQKLEALLNRRRDYLQIMTKRSQYQRTYETVYRQVKIRRANPINRMDRCTDTLRRAQYRSPFSGLQLSSGFPVAAQIEMQNCNEKSLLVENKIKVIPRHATWGNIDGPYVDELVHDMHLALVVYVDLGKAISRETTALREEIIRVRASIDR